jgi:hypothetical protein
MTTSRLSTDMATSAGSQTAKAPRPELRKDFQTELERKLEGWLGLPDTPQRAKVEGLVEDMLGMPDEKGLRHFDLTKLDREKLHELKKLQKASEDFEAVFVKGLLSKMRRSSFSEESGPMGDLAKDFMDQAVAESVAKSHSSLGIAKTVFVEMAQRVVNATDLAKGEKTTGETNGKED